MVVNRAKALSRQIYGLRRMFERYVILKTSNKKIHKKKNQILSDSQSSSSQIRYRAELFRVFTKILFLNMVCNLYGVFNYKHHLILCQELKAMFFIIYTGGK